MNNRLTLVSYRVWSVITKQKNDTRVT